MTLDLSALRTGLEKITGLKSVREEERERGGGEERRREKRRKRSDCATDK